MFTDNNLYISQFERIIQSGIVQLSDIKPSDWTEQNVIMGKPRPGPFRYDYTPYAKEIIDCWATDHPARKVVVMKGAQIGFSSGVIIPGIGWMIKNNPGNTYLMVGAADLVPKAMEKLDLMIDSAGLRDLISSQIQRKRSNKTGDTNQRKDFAGGYVSVGSANNHKAIAQVDLQNILLDDLDAMKGQSASSGNLLKLIEKRAAAYKDTYKMFLISTPLLKETSLIEPAYLLGDQRKYFIECPCCHEPIILKWSIPAGEVINALTGEVAECQGGIIYETDSHERVIDTSVGYVCYKCGGWFNDKNKYEMLNGGFWKPTQISTNDQYFSYHIPSLYAPIGMFDWLQCARDYNECSPKSGERKEAQLQVFTNTVLGETYELAGEAPTANQIQRNTRPYEIGIIPESLSIADGNGKIVLLTLGSDMNGVLDDARLDYEIVAHSESGAAYSIKHGSIGTFIPRENTRAVKTDRAHWTYEHNKSNSVWPEFNKVIRQEYRTDTGRVMKVFMPGIDVGYYPDEAHAFIDWTIRMNPENPVVGVRGNKEEKYVLQNGNLALFEVGKYRNDVYFLQVGVLKDMLAAFMQKKWHEGDGPQPTDFLNYPTPSGGLYQYENFFEHYESEHRIVIEDKDGSKKFRWVKKTSASQNHLFDCRIYNMALRDIIVKKVGKQVNARNPEKEFTWADYVQFMKG